MVDAISISLLAMFGIVMLLYTLKEVRANKELRAKQRLQSEIMNNIPDLVWFKNPAGKYLLCNHRFELFFGARGEDIYNKTDYDFVDKELADMFRKNDNLAISKNEPSINEEEVAFANDGHKEILETIKTPIYDPDNKLLGVLGIGRDITRRVKLESETANSQDLLKMVMNSIPQFIFWKDTKSVYLGCNSNFARAAGVGEPENIVGKTDYDLPWKKEEADFFVQKDQEVIRSKTPLYHIIEEQKQADGKAAWLDTNKIPMFNDEGEVVGTLGTFEDITERIQSELALKEAYEKISNTSEELKKSNEDLLKALEAAQRSKELELANEKLEELNKELNKSHAESNLLNSELVKSNEELENKNTELNNAIEHLKETQSQLLHADKMASLGILTAGVAHEINNPLNYINGGYLGLQKYFEGDKDISENHVPVLLSSIKEGVSRASQIVKGLNQFSRDNKNYDEQCDIHSILDNCLVMLHNRIKHKIEIVKDYCDAQPIVIGNVGKLHQVFVNILTNSEQAIAGKGEIKLVSSIKSGNIIIEITDNGSGIHKDHIKHISDPFFTTKSPGEGTGLGLSISHSIIADHKGKIEYKSELNKWTKVIITLPLKTLDND